MSEITEEMIEAAARALCRNGASFPTPEQTLDWVDSKWRRFKDEATLALTAALQAAEAPPVNGWEIIAEHYRTAMLLAGMKLSAVPFPVLAQGETGSKYARALSDVGDILKKARDAVIFKDDLTTVSGTVPFPISLSLTAALQAAEAQPVDDPSLWRFWNNKAREQAEKIDRLRSLLVRCERTFDLLLEPETIGGSTVFSAFAKCTEMRAAIKSALSIAREGE